jgi:hypothetical protein
VSARSRRPVLHYSKVGVPKGVQIETCRGCGDDVYWVRSLVGAVWQALDSGPDPLGRLILVEYGGQQRARQAPASDDDSVRYQLHRCSQSLGQPRREPRTPLPDTSTGC